MDPFCHGAKSQHVTLLALRISQADSYCKMKCAAIALALQGATGLVAPRLTVKSSALQAATLEASTIAAKSLARAPRWPQKPARSGTDAPAALPSSARLQKTHRTHIRGPRAAPPHLGLQKN